MPRKVNIATTCFNQELSVGFTVEQNIDKAANMLDALANIKPDLICLPETFMETGLLKCTCNEEIMGRGFTLISEKAKKIGCYIAAGAHEYIGKDKYNSAWLFNRSGELVGRYIKKHPVVYEITDSDIKPGHEIPVFQTDFGTVGIAICFDINWPEVWHTLADKGAEIVLWLSAYEGGFPLQAYARRHLYYVVSSVWTNHSKIVDISGKILASTSRWQGWTSYTIDLEKEIFHTDYQSCKLPEIQSKLGGNVEIESFGEENMFTIQSDDPDWPVNRIIDEFSLETMKSYLKRNEMIQDIKRSS